MKNIFKSGFKALTVITLLATALPACNITLGNPCSSDPTSAACQATRFSGVNVQNCGVSPNPNASFSEVHGRDWAIWVTRGNGQENPVWIPATPAVINPLPFDIDPSKYWCGYNEDQAHVAAINFADLGVVDGDQVTVRAIRISMAQSDSYQTNCHQFDAGTANCTKWCEATTDPDSCTGAANPGHALADSVDVTYTYSASRPFTTRTVEL